MEEKKVFKYEIGGKKYTQSKLVLGQVEQLLPLTEGMAFTEESGPFDIIRTFGSKISTAIAIALKEDGQPLAEKKVEKLSQTLKFEMDLDDTFKVVEDFFLCNPISSLLERLASMMESVTESLGQDGSEISSQSSPEETSPSAIKSDGDTCQKSVDLTSSTVAEK